MLRTLEYLFTLFVAVHQVPTAVYGSIGTEEPQLKECMNVVAPWNTLNFSLSACVFNLIFFTPPIVRGENLRLNAKVVTSGEFVFYLCEIYTFCQHSHTFCVEKTFTALFWHPSLTVFVQLLCLEHFLVFSSLLFICSVI